MNENRRLSVIYVRGFAGKPTGIDRAIDDPLYGFNEGSVHVRVDGHAQPQFYQFEGPLLRLIRDKKYELSVHGNQRGHLESQPDGAVPPATVWVHRFYDQSASGLRREPVEFRLEQAAEDLFEFVKLVRRKTGAPRVFLVARSMGGLICRSMIQRVIPENTNGPNTPVDYIDRLFTYGTPHGGIEFSIGFGLLEKLRDTFDLGDVAVPAQDRLRAYQQSESTKRVDREAVQQRCENRPIAGREARSGLAQLAFRDRDLVAQCQDLHLLVLVARGQQAQ
jgi:hypothetical protein